jgi:hypothetical protein
MLAEGKQLNIYNDPDNSVVSICSNYPGRKNNQEKPITVTAKTRDKGK